MSFCTTRGESRSTWIWFRYDTPLRSVNTLPRPLMVSVIAAAPQQKLRFGLLTTYPLPRRFPDPGLGTFQLSIPRYLRSETRRGLREILTAQPPPSQWNRYLREHPLISLANSRVVGLQTVWGSTTQTDGLFMTLPLSVSSCAHTANGVVELTVCIFS